MVLMNINNVNILIINIINKLLIYLKIITSQLYIDFGNNSDIKKIFDLIFY